MGFWSGSGWTRPADCHMSSSPEPLFEMQKSISNQATMNKCVVCVCVCVRMRRRKKRSTGRYVDTLCSAVS